MDHATLLLLKFTGIVVAAIVNAAGAIYFATRPNRRPDASNPPLIACHWPAALLATAALCAIFACVVGWQILCFRGPGYALFLPQFLHAIAFGVGGSYGFSLGVVTDAGKRQCLKYAVLVAGVGAHLALFAALFGGPFLFTPRLAVLLLFIGNLLLLWAGSRGIELLLPPTLLATSGEASRRRDVFRHRTLCLCLMTGIGAVYADQITPSWTMGYTSGLLSGYACIPLVFLFNGKQIRLERERAARTMP